MARVPSAQFSSREIRSFAIAAAGAGVSVIALASLDSPRSHLNIMQAMSVLFFIIVLIRLCTRKEGPASEAGESSDSTSILPVLTLTLAAGVWLTGINTYFINDDFGLLSVTPNLNSDLLVWLFGSGDGKIFYRPLTYTTFAIDQLFWGWNPVGYHLTNLILHAASTAGLFLVARYITGNRNTALMTAGIFAAMPIQVESVVWMSGRFDVLSTCLGIWTVAAYLAFRARVGVGRYAVALVLCALAICSKETAFVVPLLLAALEVLVFRTLPVLRLAGFFATAAALFAWRWMVLGGFGGYRSEGVSGMTGFGWKTLEALLVRGPSHLLLGFNWLQPSRLIPAIAALTAAMMIFLVLSAPVTRERRRIILFGCVWMFVAMIPGHFMLTIGAGLSNSRILCLASAGMALLLGQLISAISLRTRNLAYIALGVLFSLGVFHNLQAWRWTSTVGLETMKKVVQLEPSPPENAQFVISNLPEEIRGVFFFQVGLDEGLQMAYKRFDLRAYRDTAPSDEAPQIRLRWTGEPDVLIRRE
jgi:protein O-mannosyl-transferase